MKPSLGLRLLCLALLERLGTAANFTAVSAGFTNDLHSFVTRPEIKAPKFNVTYYDREKVASGYWFVAPYSFIEMRDRSVGWTPCEIGPHIYDSEGTLVWTGACTYGDRNVFDFKAVTNMDEKIHLSLVVQEISKHRGAGHNGTGLILNEHYEQETAVNLTTIINEVNVHEFNILDGGKTALAAIYRTEVVDLASLGMPGEIRDVTVGGFQEIDLSTGEVLFSWDSFSYIPLAESTYKVPHSTFDNTDLPSNLMDPPPLNAEPSLTPSVFDIPPGLPLSDVIPTVLPEPGPPSLMDLPLDDAPSSLHAPLPEGHDENHAPGSVPGVPDLPSIDKGGFATGGNKGDPSLNLPSVDGGIGAPARVNTGSHAGSSGQGYPAHAGAAAFAPDENTDPVLDPPTNPVDVDHSSSLDVVTGPEPTIPATAELPPNNILPPSSTVSVDVPAPEDSATILKPRHLPGDLLLLPPSSPYRLPWDYLHVNSLDKNSDGDYLMSARYTNTIYLISGKDGHIIWRLGGRRSDFTMKGFNFARQHHARFVEHNSTHTIISFLDNASDELFQLKNVSTAYYVLLKTTYPKTATVLRSYERPDQNLTRLRGNVQTLPNGNVFVGWSEGGYQSEFTEDGKLVMEASFASDRFSSYRSYKYNFVGRPTEPLAVKSIVHGSRADDFSTSIYVSWNGATEVVRWNFYAKADNGSVSTFIGSVPKTGFENLFVAHGYMDWITVGGVDVNGKTLGMSDVVRTEMPEGWISAFNQTGGEGNAPHLPTPDVPVDAGLEDQYTGTHTDGNIIAEKLGVEGNKMTMFLVVVGALAIIVLFVGGLVGVVMYTCKFVRRQRYTQIPTEETPLQDAEEFKDSSSYKDLNPSSSSSSSSRTSSS